MFKSDQQTNRKYVITGVLYRSEKRFKPIYTDTPQHYNIWKGTVWKLVEDENGIKHRKKMYDIFN